MRGLGLYAVFAALVLAVVVFIAPDETDLPVQSEKPWPKVSVRGLSVPAAGGGRPAFAAKVATPRSKGGVITLGGWREGVDLRGVEVELGPGVVMEGDVGTFVDGRLSVEGRVFVRIDGRRCLDASRVEIFDDQVRFVGLVVLYPTSGRSTAMDLAVTRAELVESLR